MHPHYSHLFFFLYSSSVSKPPEQGLAPEDRQENQGLAVLAGWCKVCGLLAFRRVESC